MGSFLLNVWTKSIHHIESQLHTDMITKSINNIVLLGNCQEYLCTYWRLPITYLIVGNAEGADNINFNVNRASNRTLFNPIKLFLANSFCSFEIYSPGYFLAFVLSAMTNGKMVKMVPFYLWVDVLKSTINFHKTAIIKCQCVPNLCTKPCW